MEKSFITLGPGQNSFRVRLLQKIPWLQHLSVVLAIECSACFISVCDPNLYVFRFHPLFYLKSFTSNELVLQFLGGKIHYPGAPDKWRY